MTAAVTGLEWLQRRQHALEYLYGGGELGGGGGVIDFHSWTVGGDERQQVEPGFDVLSTDLSRLVLAQPVVEQLRDKMILDVELPSLGGGNPTVYTNVRMALPAAGTPWTRELLALYLNSWYAQQPQLVSGQVTRTVVRLIQRGTVWRVVLGR